MKKSLLFTILILSVLVSFGQLGNNVVTKSGVQTLTNKTLTSPKINSTTAVSATSEELNLNDGLLRTVAEGNTLVGVTSAIQTQLDAKIAKGDSSATLSKKYATGLMLQTGLNTKANTSHNQAQSTITALPDSLLARYTKTQSTASFATIASDNSKINADYVIEKISTTYYARPSGSYTAYSNADATVVIQAAIDALTNGGNIYIKAGLYDNLGFITVSHNYITIIGAGEYLTKLKLKANADIGVVNYSGLITIPGFDHITIKNLELDGNGANQSKVDNGVTQTAVLCGIAFDMVSYTSTDNFVAENCYVHDFTYFGIYIGVSLQSLITNCHLKDNYWNNITMTRAATQCKATNNYLEGSADVSITASGTDCEISNNIVMTCNGSKGSQNSRWAIAIEGAADYTPTHIKILNNTITGAETLVGVSVFGPNTTNCKVEGNTIYSINTSSGVGISVYTSSYIEVVNNKIVDVNDQSIRLSGSSYCIISGNDITSGSTWEGILLSSSSLYNYIVDNNVKAINAITISSGCNYNYVINNVLKGNSASTEFSNNGTETIYKSNYAVTGARWIEETGALNNAVTATSDGLTTGILVPGSQYITVTSSSSAYIVRLPAASASTIGTKVTGIIGANGFQLMVQAAQSSSVYLNNLTTSKKAAIPANSTFEATCVDATHWILKAWTNLGAEITAIVPA